MRPGIYHERYSILQRLRLWDLLPSTYVAKLSPSIETGIPMPVDSTKPLNLTGTIGVGCSPSVTEQWAESDPTTGLMSVRQAYCWRRHGST